MQDHCDDGDSNAGRKTSNDFGVRRADELAFIGARYCPFHPLESQSERGCEAREICAGMTCNQMSLILSIEKPDVSFSRLTAGKR